MHLIIIISVLTIVLLWMIWASADIESGVYVKACCRGNTRQRIVSLTFDDGPDEMTDAVLSVLEEEGVKATFFLIGSKIKEQEQLVRRIVEGGHIVANHSWRHNGTFPLASAKKVGQELDWTVAEIERVTGKKPKLFRPPFGVTNPIIGRVSQSKGLVTIGWNVRSLDTVSSTPRKNVLQRIMNGIVPGSVILLHDRCEGADALLRDLIAELNKADYKIVPLDKLLDIQAYEN